MTEILKMQNEHGVRRYVYVLSTEGCKACEIMNKIIDKAYTKCLYTFIPVNIDYHNAPDFIKINVTLKDFPTVVFVENNTIKYHFSGTKSLREVLKIMNDINFNKHFVQENPINPAFMQ